MVKPVYLDVRVIAAKFEDVPKILENYVCFACCRSPGDLETSGSLDSVAPFDLTPQAEFVSMDMTERRMLTQVGNIYTIKFLNFQTPKTLL